MVASLGSLLPAARAGSGGKRQMTDSKMVAVRRLLEAGTPPGDVAKNLGISVPTLHCSEVLPVATSLGQGLREAWSGPRWNLNLRSGHGPS